MALDFGIAGTQGIRGLIEIANGKTDAGYAHLKEAGFSLALLGVVKNHQCAALAEEWIAEWSGWNS